MLALKSEGYIKYDRTRKNEKIKSLNEEHLRKANELQKRSDELSKYYKKNGVNRLDNGKTEFVELYQWYKRVTKNRR